MSDPKPNDLLQDSIAVGCGMIIKGQRWLVKSADFVSQPYPKQAIHLTLEIIPWEPGYTELYRLKPHRRRKPKIDL